MKRRDIIKGLSLLPLMGTIKLNAFSIESESVVQDYQKAPDLFKELGVIPYINAGGTTTVVSGSLMMPEVLDAINSTAHSFANMHELQDKVGEKIANMLNCEAAMVTSGAAAALVLGTAACITGSNQEKIKMLPEVIGPQPEVIIQKNHRYLFDQAVRSAGVRLIEVENSLQMEQMINENTVMALFFNAAAQFGGFEHNINHEDFVRICKRKGVPSFIDAAADVPPVENLFKYQGIGFDLVTFSGGKMIRGPQSAGLLFGRKDLIEAAKLNNSPYECPIGRPMKVNKEEIFGMYAALKSYLSRDHEKEWQDWLARIDFIRDQLEVIPSVKGAVTTSVGPANAYPRLQLIWDQNRVKITPQQVSEQLRSGKPAILAGGRGESLSVGVVLLLPNQVEIVSRRIKAILESVL